jgi:hypothetical protein
MTLKKSISLNAYDQNKNLIGEFDGEFIYRNTDGSLLPFRVDGDEVYSMIQNQTAKYIGTFESGKATHLDGTLLFQCE